MRKILTIITAFCLCLAVSGGGDFRKSGLNTELEKSLESAFFGHDTIPIIHETFYDGKLDGWTEVGGVAVVDGVLVVTVVDGENDYIEQSVVDYDEVWISSRFFLTDTSGWTDGENVNAHYLKNSANSNGLATVRILWDSGGLKWTVTHYNDAGGGAQTISSTEVDTDTWYSLVWRVKKATSDGANDGIAQLWVDGVLVASKTNWDNDAATYNRFRCGGYSSTLKCKFYMNDVKFFSREGLP